MGLLWLTYLELFMLLVSFCTFAVRTTYLYIIENAVCHIDNVPVSFSGPNRDAAQLMRKTRMDEREDPLGLQVGLFSFNMVGLIDFVNLTLHFRLHFNYSLSNCNYLLMKQAKVGQL